MLRLKLDLWVLSVVVVALLANLTAFVAIAGHRFAVSGTARLGARTSQWFRDVISLEFWAHFSAFPHLSSKRNARGRAVLSFIRESAIVVKESDSVVRGLSAYPMYRGRLVPLGTCLVVAALAVACSPFGVLADEAVTLRPASDVMDLASERDEASPDPLIQERDSLRKELASWRSVMDDFRTRETAIRQESRALLVNQNRLIDKSTVDEDTAVIIDRVKALEAELTDLRSQLKKRITNHPDASARREALKKLQDSRQVLRKERQDFEQTSIGRKRRLHEVEALIAAREKAAVEAAADQAKDSEAVSE